MRAGTLARRVAGPGGVLAAAMAAVAWPVTPATPAEHARNVKVVVEFQQQAHDASQRVEGRGGVVIRPDGGRVRGQGGVGAEDTTRRVTRSSGLFIVVQDGGSGTLLIATEVPYPHAAYYHDYVTGRGHVARGVAWRSVGTGLVVRPTILPAGRIRLVVTPRISYFTDAGGSSVELVEAATELIVSSGQRVHLGGATTSVHEVTRRILGYGEHLASREASVALTATVQ